ncbi:MAG: SGNH/GDSL hydrolase family protein [Marinilabiliaceae bacterium]|nr:SGNH/GDSL hydrolase family protein [Marinilabiliaceae bacterium]
MMRIHLLKIIIGIGILLASSIQTEAKKVQLNNPNIHVKGANYVFPSADKLHYCRFSEATLTAPLAEKLFNSNKAITNSGIKIQFKTASRVVKLTFTPQDGDNRGSEFAVLQNGEMTGTYDFKGNAGKTDMLLEITNAHAGQATLFEVVLPSWANVAVTQMNIDAHSELKPITPQNKPIYLALGNSITHGVGQGSASYLTYPYLLAEKLGLDYYNLAVGGAKISQPIAAQTAEMPQADIITLLIGYNDLFFNDKTVEQYTSSYRDYLTEIRKNQPKATIFCISLTHTRSTYNPETGVVPDDYRLALKTLVEEFQSNCDHNLVFVAGDAITSEENLRQDKPADKVHMGIEGAALFADELASIITTATANETTFDIGLLSMTIQSRQGQVFIDAGCCNQKTVNIYNLQGTMVASANIRDVATLDVPSNGIYLVNVQAENRMVQSKVLIR